MGCAKDDVYDAVEGIIGRYGALKFSELVKLVLDRLRELGCDIEERDAEEILDMCLGFADPALCVALCVAP